MSAKFEAPWRDVAAFTGVAALFSWVIAFAAAAPRLAGHCPACFEAAAMTIAFLAAAWLARGQERRTLVRA